LCILLINNSTAIYIMNLTSVQSESLLNNKNKLMVDTTFLFDQFSKRGIGRYGKEVLKRLIDIIIEDSKWELHLLGFLNLNQNLIQLNISQFRIESIISKVFFHSIGEPTLSGVMNIKRWYESYKPIIERVKPQIFYAIHFERGLPSTNIFKNALSFLPKTIVMAHDAIPIATNSYSSKGPIANFIRGVIYKYLFSGIRNANLILTNSIFSKNDLIKYGEIDGNKIHPIYLGVDKSFFRGENNVAKDVIEKTLEIYNVKAKSYFFYDAGLEANKGIMELLSFFNKLIKINDLELPNYLVIAGGDFLKGEGKSIKYRNNKGKKILNEIRKMGIIDNIITTDKISNEDLEIILFNSKAYLNFSQYEGFSFGPIQAMAAEIPALVSNSSCTPEITKDGALLLDLTDTDKALNNAIVFLKDLPRLKEQVKKGVEIAKQYDWNKTVSETWKLINSLI